MNRFSYISHIVLSLSMVISFVGLSAQSLSNFTEELSLLEEADTTGLARYVNVTINQDESAQRAFEALIEQSIDEESGDTIRPTRQGYRIGVFFDNGPSARAMAMEVMKLCDSLLTDIPAAMSYDNPYFKVSAGYCISQEEAVMTLHRVQKYFPSAYLMREHVTPQDLLKVRDAEQRLKDRVAAADSLSQGQM